MSRYRVQQWGVFSKKYYLFDAYKQCPMLTGQKISEYLIGNHKRIYAKGEDVGDFVIIFNTRHISVKDNSYFWKRIVYPIHTRFGRRRIDQTMEELHQRDPCGVIKKEVRVNLPKGFLRSTWESRLFTYPDGIETVPNNIISNVSGVIRQVMPVPKRLDEYSKEELDVFPKLFDWPENYAISRLSVLNKDNK